MTTVPFTAQVMRRIKIAAFLECLFVYPKTSQAHNHIKIYVEKMINSQFNLPNLCINQITNQKNIPDKVEHKNQ